VWAAAGLSAGSIVLRSTANEATFSQLYIIDAPQFSTSAINKGYFDTALADARPALTVVYLWDGSAWTYKGAVVTAPSTDAQAGDIHVFYGGTALPAWAPQGSYWSGPA
jgi:hypothetical protein